MHSDTNNQTTSENTKAEEKVVCTIDDLAKLDIRIGTIELAERAEGADKLLKLIINFGSEKRQIMSAIAEYYPNPQVLVGKQIPALLNIEFRKFRGHESQGMIIATDADGKVVFLTPENIIPNGSSLK